MNIPLQDNYSCDIVRGVPGGLSEFLQPLQNAGTVSWEYRKYHNMLAKDCFLVQILEGSFSGKNFSRKGKVFFLNFFRKNIGFFV